MSAKTVIINASTPNATSTQNTLHNIAHMHRAFTGGATVCILKDTAVVKNMILRKQGVTHEITAEQYKELYDSLVTTDKDGNPQITYRQVEGRMQSFRNKHPLLGGVGFGKWVRANLPNGKNWAESDATKEATTYDLHNFTEVAPATPAEVPAPTLSGIDDLLAEIVGAPSAPESTPAPTTPSLESWTVNTGDEVREYLLPSEPVAVAEEASLVVMKAFLTTNGYQTVGQVDRLDQKKIAKIYNAAVAYEASLN